MENSNLPQEYKSSLFGRIKRFFANLFGKKEIIEETFSEAESPFDNIKEDPIRHRNTIETLKEDNKRYRIRNQILTQVRLHPELLEKTSVEKLEEVNIMFDEKIEENDRKISYLNDEINKLQGRSA